MLADRQTYGWRDRLAHRSTEIAVELAQGSLYGHDSGSLTHSLFALSLGAFGLGY